MWQRTQILFIKMANQDLVHTLWKLLIQIRSVNSEWDSTIRTKPLELRFDVIMAVNMKITVFWDYAM